MLIIVSVDGLGSVAPPEGGSYHRRNDFYVGRDNISRVAVKQLVPWKLNLNQPHYHSKSWKSPMDFFIPSLVRNPFFGAFGFEEDSDTCTTWKGLSSVGAQELYSWASLYQTVLKQRTDSGDYAASLTSIVDEMVERHQRRPPTGLNWFISAPNTYQIVKKFLSMSTETPSLQVEELEVPLVGREYTLATRLLNITDDLSDDLATNTVFSTSVDWMSFDASCNAFSGIVPIAPPRHIVVKVKIVQYLDETVRLEHVVRAKMTLRSRAGTTADNHLTELFKNPSTNCTTVQNNAKPRKQVSFAEEEETDSSHSSPDHLRTFFNELASLTCASTYDNTSKDLTCTDEPPCKAICLDDDSTAHPAPLLGSTTVVEHTEDSIISVDVQDPAAGAARASNYHPLVSVNSSGDMYPHLRHAQLGSPDSRCEDTNSGPKSGMDITKSQENDEIDLHVRYNCARDASCGGRHKANRTWNKPLSILNDIDGNLDLEVALGLSDPRRECGVHAFQTPDPSPVAVRNHFGSLSKCSNMDRPTQACESAAGNATDSQPDAYDRLQHGTLVCDSSEVVSNRDGLDRHWKDLFQWNWRGWEQEMGIMKRSCNKKPGSDTPSDRFMTCLHAGADSGSWPHARQALGNHYRDIREQDREVVEPQSFDFRADAVTLESSSATTDARNLRFSEESWTIEATRTVVKEAPRPTDTSRTLYDTVRKQFYKDYLIRQTSSPRDSKSSSARRTSSSLFSSDYCCRKQAGSCRDYAKHAACSIDPKDETATTASSQPLGTAASHAHTTHLGEHEPDVKSFAAAVRNSLDMEVQGQDRREKVEIRKGILHHQVMEQQKSERRRQFGSSNYDDVFWSSDAGSVDHKSIDGIE